MALTGVVLALLLAGGPAKPCLPAFPGAEGAGIAVFAVSGTIDLTRKNGKHSGALNIAQPNITGSGRRTHRGGGKRGDEQDERAQGFQGEEIKARESQ